MAFCGTGIPFAVSDKSHRICGYMQALCALLMYRYKHEFLKFVYQAFDLGFSEKWRDLKVVAGDGTAT